MNDYAQFADRDYDEQTFSELRLEGELVKSRRFYGCRFTKCVLTEVDFSGSLFNDCTFEECDLSLINVEGCEFTNVTFSACKLMGVNWAVIQQEGKFLKPFDFINCNLNYSTFTGLKLAQVAFRECAAHDADFAECDLTRADFRHADLKDSRFLHSDLRSADFRSAMNYDITPEINEVKGAKFSLPEAVSLLRNIGIIIDDDNGESR